MCCHRYSLDYVLVRSHKYLSFTFLPVGLDSYVNMIQSLLVYVYSFSTIELSDLVRTLHINLIT